MRRIKKILCVVLAVTLCLSMTNPVSAATEKEKKAIASYEVWLKKNFDYGYYDIVDIDGNGIPELLVNDYSEYRIFTYDYGKKERVPLLKKEAGRAGSLYAKNGIRYSTKRKYFAYVTGDTAGDEMIFYSLKGKTIKKISTYTCKYGRLGTSAKYYKNGRKISKASYTKKTNAALKGYKSLRYN